MAGSSAGEGQPSIHLLVEDNPGDARLAQEAYSEVGLAGDLCTVSSGDEALEYVNQRGEYTEAPKPVLIFLDWHLSGTGGEEVLTELKSDPDLKHIPVIVLTGSQNEREVTKTYQTHANACIPKTSDPDELIDMVRVMKEFWLEFVRLPTSDEGDGE